MGQQIRRQGYMTVIITASYHTLIKYPHNYRFLPQPITLKKQNHTAYSVGLHYFIEWNLLKIWIQFHFSLYKREYWIVHRRSHFSYVHVTVDFAWKNILENTLVLMTMSIASSWQKVYKERSAQLFWNIA